MQLGRVAPERLANNEAARNAFGEVEEDADTDTGEIVVVGALLEIARPVGQGAAVVDEDDAVQNGASRVGGLVFLERAADAQFCRDEVAIAAGKQTLRKTAHGVGAADLELFAGRQEAGILQLQATAQQ